jgi:hypothetical protein
MKGQEKKIEEADQRWKKKTEERIHAWQTSTLPYTWFQHHLLQCQWRFENHSVAPQSKCRRNVYRTDNLHCTHHVSLLSYIWFTTKETNLDLERKKKIPICIVRAWNHIY